ncbi:MAG: amidohydrolase family protein [Clostridia bacterium]|nr:amidohydrolase family protein [Clostridia bacterium]
MIIDAHTHTFPAAIAGKVVEKLQAMGSTRAYTDATDDALQRSMQAAGIDVSVLLPVMTNPGQVEKLNDRAAEKTLRWRETGLFSLGGMHPDYENYRAELARIRANGLTGIKLHPAYQGCDLDDPRFLRIIDRAAELDLAVVVHAGLDIGFPGHNYADAAMVETVLREIAPKKFVLAHMGGWKDWDAVEQRLTGLPLWLDTSFALGSYTPPAGVFVPDEERRMLSDAQFRRIVEKHGADRVLFGTDSPWSDQRATLAQVRALLPEAVQPAVLGDNAAGVFGISPA